MAKQMGNARKAAPKKDRAWFERKVAELKAAAESLPADRRAKLLRELEKES
jgi:hypothetical protein